MDLFIKVKFKHLKYFNHQHQKMYIANPARNLNKKMNLKVLLYSYEYVII